MHLIKIFVCEWVCCVYLCMCGVWQHVYIMLGSCHTQREAREGHQVFSSMTFYLIFLGFLADPSAHGFLWLPVQQFPMFYLSLATTRALLLLMAVTVWALRIELSSFLLSQTLLPTESSLNLNLCLSLEYLGSDAL